MPPDATSAGASPVTRQFAKVPPNPPEAELYGPYNQLLCVIFPMDTALTVVPQYMLGPRDSADFLFLLEVRFEDKPVLIVELKPPGDLRYVSKREAADNQIRERIKEVIDDCHIPVLYAPSAMGTRLCFYTKRPGQPVYPRAITAELIYETDTARQEPWDYDILEEEGEQKFRAMIEEIKRTRDAL